MYFAIERGGRTKDCQILDPILHRTHNMLPLFRSRSVVLVILCTGVALRSPFAARNGSVASCASDVPLICARRVEPLRESVGVMRYHPVEGSKFKPRL